MERTQKLKVFLLHEHKNLKCQRVTRFEPLFFVPLRPCTRYEETTEKMDEIDEDEMSDADSLYYLEVQPRISRKLLEAGQ